MNHSLNALDHAGFQVSLYDDDTVTEANRGRQLFAASEVGLQKAAALIARCNRFFGTQWKAIPQRFSQECNSRAAIYISCTDTAASRFAIAKVLTQEKQQRHYDTTARYWMDYGNSRQSGQALLASIGCIKQPHSEMFETIESLPFVTEEFGELLRASDTEDTPSCSLAEALEKQDLFINATLVQMGCSLLWQLLRNGYTTQRGIFLNLGEFRAATLEV